MISILKKQFSKSAECPLISNVRLCFIETTFVSSKLQGKQGCYCNFLGESKSVENLVKVPWTETTLSTIFSKYQLKDLFNTDEFELFSQRLPDKTFNLGSEKCSGSKKSKISLTRMVAVNACD